MAAEQRIQVAPSAASPSAEQMLAALKDWEIFGRSIVHELCGPIATAHAFSQVITEHEEGRLTISGRRHLLRIRQSLLAAQHLLAGVCELSPLSTFELVRTEVDLTRLAKSCIEQLRLEHPTRRVDVHIDEGITAFADRMLVGLAIRNLLSNAWKFTAGNPLARICFRVDRSAATNVSYCVQDNGLGFDMSDAHRLFQPFSQLHRGDSIVGSGLGLALVRQVVHRHGGIVWAHAKPSEGALFFFTLSGDYKNGEHASG